MRSRAAPAALLFALHPLVVAAEEPPPCPVAVALTRADVVRCVLLNDLPLRAAREEVVALQGRRVTAETVLPSRPTLELRAAQRELLGHPDVTAFNGGVKLSQEFELGGQRGARLGVADAELGAANQRLATLTREARANATRAYLRLLAAQENAVLVREFASLAQALAAAATGREREELVSKVDATVAVAEAARLRVRALEAERVRSFAAIELASALGQPEAEQVRVTGFLEMPAAEQISLEPLISKALAARADVAAASAERDAAQWRVKLLERERVPSITVAGFAEREEFGQRVLGGTLSFPLPLPGSLWPSRRGEIDEAQARVLQASTNVEGVARRVRAEVVQAVREEQFRADSVSAYPAGARERAREGLRSLASALAAGRLGVRDALINQRALVDLLEGELSARLGLALARVELRRASALEDGEGAP